MKGELWAGDLMGQIVVIENVPCQELPTGYKTTLRLKGSGQLIPNVIGLEITMLPMQPVTATLTLWHNAPGCEEKATIKNPELHLEAIVECEKHLRAALRELSEEIERNEHERL